MSTVDADRVVAKVEMQCGPQREVSLMDTEVVNELGSALGVLTVAMIKPTNLFRRYARQSSAKR